MEARAKVTHVRISPQKVTIVLDLIRNKPVIEARAILKNTPKAASEYLIKLLDSAVANAENNFHMNKENLFVSEALVGPGPILKRMRPVSKGRGYRINKRTSRITIVVSEKE